MKYDSDFIVFRSKRNTVILRGCIVEKRFASTETALFEAGMLKLLHKAGVRVPNPVSVEGSLMKMPYIAGETLPDILDRFEILPDQNALEKVVQGIIRWLSDFYRAVSMEETGIIRGDVNGRNFLWDGGSCWGVDFEERVKGVKEQDIGRLLAYVLTYDPPKTPVKMAFADKLLRDAVCVFSIDPGKAFYFRDQEFAAMFERRGS